MALGQLNIETMNKMSKEYFVQNEWAKAYLRKIGNTCPRGCRWERRIGGYRCDEGFHWATDQMVSEGLGKVVVSNRVVPEGFPDCGKKLRTPNDE